WVPPVGLPRPVNSTAATTSSATSRPRLSGASARSRLGIEMAGPLAEPVHRASCACGEIELHASGEPRRVGLCHCLDCRKRHAAPVSAFAIFERSAVLLTGPGQGPLPHAALGTFHTKSGYRQAFCTRCGAHVFGLKDRSEEIELLLGSFDE